MKTLSKYRKVYNYLYLITNNINFKIYVGCHQTDNLDDGYMGSGIALRAAQNKYGIENFSIQILDFYPSAEKMFEAEKKVVTREFILDSNNYNIAEGGGGGYKGESCYASPTRSAKLSNSQKHRATVRDANGNIMKIHITDQRYISKELIGVTKGKVITKDSFGTSHFVSIDDPRISTGELVGITKGYTMAKDLHGNKMQVPSNDPRFATGELVGHTRGSVQTAESNRKRSDKLKGTKKPQALVQCDICGMTSIKTNIIRWHKNCKQNKI